MSACVRSFHDYIISGSGSASLVIWTIVGVFRFLCAHRKINIFRAEGIKCAMFTYHQGMGGGGVRPHSNDFDDL